MSTPPSTPTSEIPSSAETTTAEAYAAMRNGRVDEARGRFEQLLAAEPGDIAAWDGLAQAFRLLGRPEDAINTYGKALETHGNDAGLLNNMGLAYRAIRDEKNALRALQAAALARPEWHQPLANLSTLFRDVGDLDRSSRCLMRALAISPDDSELQNSLGSLKEREGYIPEALAAYRRAIELSPENVRAHSNLLYISHFDEASTPETIARDHLEFQRQHAEPLLVEIKPWAAEALAGRRLRVGYVSPDFRYHPVGQFMMPILRGHDRARVEVFCYSSLPRSPDEVTGELQKQSEHWRDISALSDAAAAELVRQDRIDVLVDLAMHMAGNRALLFARKPARVQLCYLAYCSTTGLSAMDYRVADPHFDPPDSEDDYVERTLKLPRSYWCYEPRAEVAVGTAKSAEAGVTFGCLNNANKLSPAALNVWFDILSAVPGSKLLLHAADGEPRKRVMALAAEAGIEAERVSFVGFLPIVEYYEAYQRIDIALDPFPYAGGTTSCDALYMGVPLITLAGRTPVGRGGVSLLTNLGLSEFIAASEGEYIAKATALAGNTEKRQTLRAGLRDRMKSSAVMDSAGFVRDWETLLFRAARD